jgi:hypothetical protein
MTRTTRDMAKLDYEKVDLTKTDTLTTTDLTEPASGNEVVSPL